MKDKVAIEEKSKKLAEMTASFCDEKLDDDYKQLCQKLIIKMKRKRNVPFLTGKLEIWAAAIIYALGSERKKSLFKICDDEWVYRAYRCVYG